MVHVDCLLAYVLKNRVDFLRNRFPAVLNEPLRKDLWTKFEEIFKNYEPTQEEIDAYANATTSMPTPNEQAALRFFEENKEEMLIGEDPNINNGNVSVLWPQRFPIEKLMIIKTSVGSKAWATEYQNTAVDEAGRIFTPEKYRRHNIEYFNPNEYDIYASCDWAMGKHSHKGDFSVFLLLAKHKKTKKLYLVDYHASRIPPNDFMNVICDMTLKYEPILITSETNFAQEYMTNELKTRLQLLGYPGFTRVKGIAQRQKKELRIEVAAATLEKGDLILNNHCSDLEEEMNTFPNGSHDDRLDALSLCIKSTEQSKASFRSTPDWLLK